MRLALTRAGYLIHIVDPDEFGRTLCGYPVDLVWITDGESEGADCPRCAPPPPGGPGVYVRHDEGRLDRFRYGRKVDDVQPNVYLG